MTHIEAGNVIAGATPLEEEGPDDLEILRFDAELAWNRYLTALAAEGRQSEGDSHERSR
jgi:hypothetical protein